MRNSFFTSFLGMVLLAFLAMAVLFALALTAGVNPWIPIALIGASVFALRIFDDRKNRSSTDPARLVRSPILPGRSHIH
jgi:uncharacterized membrane-anchored protein